MTDPFPAIPKVVIWFKVYAGCLCFLYLAVAAFSLLFFLADPGQLEMSTFAATLMGMLFLVLGLGLLGVCLVPLLLEPRPWLWTYNLVVICLGMTSACCLPFCIPLLIYWMKPETKSYFGKT